MSKIIKNPPETLTKSQQIKFLTEKYEIKHSKMANFYRVVRSLLVFSLAQNSTKYASKVQKYGPEMREITPKWCINLGYDVEHVKIAQEILDSNFWE